MIWNVQPCVDAVVTVIFRANLQLVKVQLITFM